MALQSVVIESIQQRVSAREQEYLLLRLRASPASPAMFATCWRDCADIWSKLHEACDGKASIVLDVAYSDKAGPDGRPFASVVGVEHPGQGQLF